MDRLKAQINVSGGATSASASIETMEANLPGALRLAAEILREPAFPDSEFETVRQQRIAAAEASRSDPQALAITEFQRRMNPVSARRRALRLHRRRADRRPQEGHARRRQANSTSSSTAPASAKSPSPASSTRPRSPSSPPSSSAIGRARAPTPASPTCTRRWSPPTRRSRPPTSRTPSSSPARSVKINDEDPDYPAMVMANYMFGASGLGTRLSRRIRDKEGLSYGVSPISARPPRTMAAISWPSPSAIRRTRPRWKPASATNSPRP